MKRYMMCVRVLLLAGTLASCGGGGGDGDSGSPPTPASATPTPTPIPTGPSTTGGAWSAPVSLPIVTIHMLALPDGKVLPWRNPRTPPRAGGRVARAGEPADRDHPHAGLAGRKGARLEQPPYPAQGWKNPRAPVGSLGGPAGARGSCKPLRQHLLLRAP